jgi:hypothetical protein
VLFSLVQRRRIATATACGMRKKSEVINNMKLQCCLPYLVHAWGARNINRVSEATFKTLFRERSARVSCN